MAKTTACLITLLCLAGCGGPRQVSRSGAGAYEASLTRTAIGFAVAWYDKAADGKLQAKLALSSPDGTPADSATRITNNPTSSLIPAIRPAGTGCALAWNEHEPGADSAHGASGQSKIAFALAGN